MLLEEARHVWSLQQRELIREIWFTQPANDAVLILECGSLAEAEALVNAFPLVKAGLIEFQVTQLVPYTGFSRLFAD